MGAPVGAPRAHRRVNLTRLVAVDPGRDSASASAIARSVTLELSRTSQFERSFAPALDVVGELLVPLAGGG